MRLFLAALSLLVASSGCVLTSGPSCVGSCDKVVACKGLNRTFRLSCGRIGSTCFDEVAVCAQCIDEHSCEQLIAGACDPECVVETDGG
jgi:hypothetical protein